MQIPCPYCGTRSHEEFSYGGDANKTRPTNPEFGPDWVEYVYLRTNPAGAHRELWYHGAGCRAWLLVERNTLNHVIGSVSVLERQ